MSVRNNGGPAFPVSPLPSGSVDVGKTGMSLRQYYAGQALAGAIASMGLSEDRFFLDRLAAGCLMAADSVLAAEKKETQGS